MEKQHSKLSPSNAARRMVCPGSRAMEERYGKNEPSEASLEGELAHRVAADYLEGYLNAHAIDHSPHLGTTEEMRRGAELYVNAIKMSTHSIHHLHVSHIKEQVKIKDVHNECFGAPDFWAYNHVNKTFNIYDYKFGFKEVEVFENYELLEYAIGVVSHYFERSIFDLIDTETYTVNLHIIQPRCFSASTHRMWNLSLLQLQEYCKKIKEVEAIAVQQDGGPLKPSDQCKYCTANHMCTALQKTADGACDDIYSSSIPKILDSQELGVELKRLHIAAKILESRILALEQQAVNDLKEGKRIPHFTLGESKKREYWTKTLEEIVELGQAFKIDVKKPQELITPRQAVSKGIPNEVISQYSASPRGDLILVPENIKKISEIFNS